MSKLFQNIVVMVNCIFVSLLRPKIYHRKKGYPFRSVMTHRRNVSPSAISYVNSCPTPQAIITRRRVFLASPIRNGPCRLRSESAANIPSTKMSSPATRRRMSFHRPEEFDRYINIVQSRAGSRHKIARCSIRSDTQKWWRTWSFIKKKYLFEKRANPYLSSK